MSKFYFLYLIFIYVIFFFFSIVERFYRDREQGSRGHGGGNNRNGRGGYESNYGNNDSRFSGRGGGNPNAGSGGIKGKQPGSALKKVNWDIRSLEPLKKDFYVEHSAVRNRLIAIFFLKENYF